MSRSNPARRGSALLRAGILLALITSGWPAEGRGGHLGAVQFEVSAQGVRITGDLYGRFLPTGTLQVGLARVVDLDQEPGYRPWIKTNGIGLPWYRSGWHRLKDREQALVFLTRANVAVYVPTTQGFALLITPDRPAELLAALQHPTGVPATFRIAGR